MEEPYKLPNITIKFLKYSASLINKHLFLINNTDYKSTVMLSIDSTMLSFNHSLSTSTLLMWREMCRIYVGLFLVACQVIYNAVPGLAFSIHAQEVRQVVKGAGMYFCASPLWMI